MKLNNIQIDVFIILLLKLLYVVRIRGKDDSLKADMNELRAMLNTIKTDRDFFTRKVFIDDDEEGSIDEYYHSEVTKANVYKLFHVLNIALSCEYSEIAYHYITLSDKSIDRCLAAVQEQQHQMPLIKEHLFKSCLELYYSTTVTNIIEHTEIMVLSLAYLMKFAKNAIFKYHEVLKYLLLWYTFTYHNNQTRNQISSVEPIKITNYQIKSSLERFIFKHCHKPGEFLSFSYQVNDKTNGDVDVLIQTIRDKLKSLAIHNYQSVQTKYVINSSNEELKTLITLLENQVQPCSIKITMEKSKIKDNEKLTGICDVFDNSIKNSLDLNEIFLYNHTLIQVVYEVIIRHEMKAVQTIMTDNSVTNKDGDCFKLLEKVENYIKNNRDDALYEQSIILRRKLLENRESLADVCRLMKDTKEHEQINKIVDFWASETKWVHEIKINADFESFLDSLAKTRIAAKFHPAVLNAFWEKTEVVYVAEHIWDYGWDLKLYTMYNETVNSVLCDKISEPIERLYDIYLDFAYWTNIDWRLITLEASLERVIVQIANITLNVPPQYSLDWEKILLTLLHNKNNTRLFNKVHMKRLNSFLYAMQNLIREKRFVLCSCGASSDPDAVGNCADSVNGHWTENVENIDQIENVTKLQGLMWYRKEFQIITDRIEKLNAVFQSQVQIYWDGNKKHLTDVYNSYKDQAFDIQDAQDYANFFVKWVIAIPYTRLMLLVHGMVGKSKKDVTSKEMAEIKTSVDSFKNIVLANSSVGYYFTNLVSTLKSFFEGNSNDLQTILAVIYDEIGILDVVALPESIEDYSEWISEFLSDINQLVSLLALSKDEEKIMGSS